MPNLGIEEFAKKLILEVRDAAIQSCDRGLRADAVDPIAKRWREAGGDADLQSIVAVVIPDIVDETIFHLLRAIDQGLMQLSFTASNGKKADLSTDGLSELSGRYLGSGSWRSLYSKERFVDDFSDLQM